SRDWSSDVCSSDLLRRHAVRKEVGERLGDGEADGGVHEAERLAGALGAGELRRDRHLARVEGLHAEPEGDGADAPVGRGVVEGHVGEVGGGGGAGAGGPASGGEGGVPEQRARVVGVGHDGAAEGRAARVHGDLEELQAGGARAVRAEGREDLGARRERGGQQEEDGGDSEGHRVWRTSYCVVRRRASVTPYATRDTASELEGEP